MMTDIHTTLFAPQLYIRSGITDIDFYIKAFDAIELRRWPNEDASLHVAELSINGPVFHLHQENPGAGSFCPGRHKGTTITIGLYVPDADACMNKAVAAGATVISPMQDFDYGYRQGKIKDPFGPIWMIQNRI